MKFIETPKKDKPGKEAHNYVLNKYSTPKLLWFIVKRHRVGLLATWAILMTAVYIFPPLPDIVIGLLSQV